MATTDPPVPQLGNGKHIHGPQFICNLEGLVLEISSQPEVSVFTRQFTGDRKQQWVFQYNSSTGKVSLVSLHDGRYLSTAFGQGVMADGTPYYWALVGEGGRRYSLRTETNNRRYLTLPTPPGICTTFTNALMNTKFVVLANTPGIRAALRTGSIGPYAHPGAAAYHTFGTERFITIRNHLNTTLYAAVSGAGRNSQYAIEPGQEEDWVRSAGARVHLSTSISDTGEQIVRVCAASSGMKLHIKDLGQAKWQGIRSVPINEAKYTANPGKPKHIGIKNGVDFEIYVSVFSTVVNGNTAQYSIKPGATVFWSRLLPETVFVGVGSAPGLPQAYVGRPGHILHIDDWKPRGVRVDDMSGEPVA